MEPARLEPLATPGERVVVRGRGVYIIDERGLLQELVPLANAGSRGSLDMRRPSPLGGRRDAITPETEVLLLKSVTGDVRYYAAVKRRELWLRAPISVEESDRVLELLPRRLPESPEDDPGPAPTHERIRRGEMGDLVQMYRVLRTRAGLANLTQEEDANFQRVEGLLIDELAAVRNLALSEARALLPQAPALSPECDALVKSVSEGRAPLPQLASAGCPEVATTWAVLHARTSPQTGHLARARRTGGGLVPHDFMGGTRIAWEGECLARVEEALGPDSPTPPGTCLSSAVIREEDHPEELALEDARAGFVIESPRLQRAWRECRDGPGTAEACLDALLPLDGPPVVATPEGQRWIAWRGELASREPSAREGRCRLALHDDASGSLAYVCDGPLIEAVCPSTYTVSLVEAPKRSCAPDLRSMVVLSSVGRAASAGCVRASRDAVGAPNNRFVAARQKAFDSCWNDEEPGDRDEESGGGKSYRSRWRDEGSVPPATRALLQRVLDRQKALFGALALPARCERGAPGCVVVKSEVLGGDEVGRIVARGCGRVLWAVLGADGFGGIATGHWSEWEGQWLTRLKAGERPRMPHREDFDLARTMPSRPPFGIGNSLREGSLRNLPRSKTHDGLGQRYRTLEAELIAAVCAELGGVPQLCTHFAYGGAISASRDVDHSLVERVRQLVAREWPRASSRLKGRQRELEAGLWLDERSGESRRETCEPVLLDACTGDVAELCSVARHSGRFSSCDGRQLQDGRCEVWRFGRLPLLR